MAADIKVVGNDSELDKKIAESIKTETNSRAPRSDRGKPHKSPKTVTAEPTKITAIEPAESSSKPSKKEKSSGNGDAAIAAIALILTGAVLLLLLRPYFSQMGAQQDGGDGDFSE
jgi:hypothetical protein